MPAKSALFPEPFSPPLPIRYLGEMRSPVKIAAILLGVSLVSACGGSGEEAAVSESAAATTESVIGRQELLTEQELTVLDQTFAYPKKGPAEISSAISSLEPGQETGWQLHRIPVYVYVMSGTYTVEYEAGVTKEFPAGSAFMQAVKTSYNGINKGEETVQLLTVYMGAKGKRIVVPQ